MRINLLVFLALAAFPACRDASRPAVLANAPKRVPLQTWFKGVAVADEPGAYDTNDALAVYDHLHQLGVRAVELTPAAYMADLNKPSLMWRNRARVREGVLALHQRGFAVLIKPYIWSHVFYTQPGKWTGEIEMQNAADWHAFFGSYRDFILLYATIAEETHAELFSIGLEYPKTFGQTAEWDTLIRAVRAVYHGPITYASTGVDEAEKVPFWDKLDVIGVDAFVPLTDNQHPTKDELVKAWQPYTARLDSLHRRYNLPVVFTEAGYKSCVGAACRPWEWNELTPHPIDLEQQALCYDALAESLFNKPWFSGIFWWKYYTSLRGGGKKDTDFIPLGKPAEGTLARWFRGLQR